MTSEFGLSSIVNEAIKTISSQFIFFTKRFWVRKKHQSAKQTTFTLLEDLYAKNCYLCCFLFAFFLFWKVVFGLICVFVRSKSFHKKNWLEIVLIASFTILLSTNGNINEKVLNKIMPESGKCIVFSNIVISLKNN